MTERVLAKRDAKDYSQSALVITSEILNINPEFYTVWNYRRDILTLGVLPNCDDETKSKTYDAELDFTMAQLRKVPKCYWVWLHRQWLLKHNPDANLIKEMAIVEKLLEMDSRNFHGWHYRRFVVGLIESKTGHSQALKEFHYTTKLINNNFSNYSALHNRTKLIETIFEQKALLIPETEEDKKVLSLFTSKMSFLEKELEYFKNAIYTDPDDQSVWLYLNWLLTADLFSGNEFVPVLISQINDIEELNSLEKEDNGVDNKWCLKVKSSIELLLFNKYGIENYKNYEGVEVSTKANILEEVETLKIADPKRVNRYVDIQKSLTL